MQHISELITCTTKISTKKRRGFLFTMPLMLGMGILIFSSMIAISQLFVTVGGPMVPDLLADMPTIFHYTQDGQRIPQHLPVFTSDESTITINNGESEVSLTEKQFAESFPSIAMYSLMVKISVGIFVVLIMLAGISYFFEEFNIVRQGTAYGIIAKMIVLIPIYLVLPYLWDMTALVIESSSLYLMDPFGGNPQETTTNLWCMMGSVTCSIDGNTTVDPVNIFDTAGNFNQTTTLSQDSWSNALQNPLFGEEYLINVLLALFKGFAVMFMTAMMFVLSAVRVMLTEVIIISFPLVSAIGLIPWINTSRISEMFQQNLIGLSMAPIMSAIVLSTGLSTIDSQNMPPLRMWFQLLSVGFLAVFFPVMLSPMLGNLSTRVGNMVSTSITSASVAGSTGIKGITQSFSRGSDMSKNASGTVTSLGGFPQLGRFQSANVGAFTSGANLTGMSVLDKMGMMMHGTSAGMAGLGTVPIPNSVPTNTIQNVSVNKVVPPSSPPSPPLHIDNHTVMNPGSYLDVMIQGGKANLGKMSGDKTGRGTTST